LVRYHFSHLSPIVWSGIHLDAKMFQAVDTFKCCLTTQLFKYPVHSCYCVTVSASIPSWHVTLSTFYCDHDRQHSRYQCHCCY